MQNLNKGFSLIELIITMGVFAILTSMALTFSGAFLQDNRMSSANNDLVGSINMARSIAVSKGQRASICSSTDNLTCTNTAWELGWIVFSDGGVAGVVDGDDRIFKVSNSAAIDISITNPGGFIQFKPQGAIASVCANCLDKTIYQRLDTLFIASIKNLFPVADANASGDSGNSGDSGGSGGSGNSGNSGHSGAVVKSCVAPDSKVTNGYSGSSGGSGNSGSGNSGSGNSGSGNSGDDSASNFKQYYQEMLAGLEKISPIPSAYASESGDSGDSGRSGTSGSPGNATCDDGSGSVQVAIDDSSFLICDSSRANEGGRLISVSHVGRITRSKTICN